MADRDAELALGHDRGDGGWRRSPRAPPGAGPIRQQETCAAVISTLNAHQRPPESPSRWRSGHPIHREPFWHVAQRDQRNEVTRRRHRAQKHGVGSAIASGRGPCALAGRDRRSTAPLANDDAFDASRRAARCTRWEDGGSIPNRAPEVFVTWARLSGGEHGIPHRPPSTIGAPGSSNPYLGTAPWRAEGGDRTPMGRAAAGRAIALLVATGYARCRRKRRLAPRGRPPAGAVADGRISAVIGPRDVGDRPSAARSCDSRRRGCSCRRGSSAPRWDVGRSPRRARDRVPMAWRRRARRAGGN